MKLDHYYSYDDFNKLTNKIIADHASENLEDYEEWIWVMTLARYIARMILKRIWQKDILISINLLRYIRHISEQSMKDFWKLITPLERRHAYNALQFFISDGLVEDMKIATIVNGHNEHLIQLLKTNNYSK